MTITAKKNKLGVQDLLFDKVGTGASTSVEKSDGNSRLVDHLNAGKLPTTTVTRAKKRASNATSAATDVGGSIDELYDDTNSIGVPDDDTLENSTGTLRIKANGVDTNEVKAEAITTTEIKDATIATGDIALLAIDDTLLKADSVLTVKIIDLAVTTAKIALLAITKIVLNVGQTKRHDMWQIEDLAAGADIAERAEWVAPSEGCAVTKVGLLQRGTATVGVDGANPLTIDIKNKTAGNTIKSEVFTSNLAADSFSVFTGIANTTLSGNDVISLTVTQGATADADIMAIYFEYTQTDA